MPVRPIGHQPPPNKSQRSPQGGGAADPRRKKIETNTAGPASFESTNADAPAGDEGIRAEAGRERRISPQSAYQREQLSAASQHLANRKRVGRLSPGPICRSAEEFSALALSPGTKAAGVPVIINDQGMIHNLHGDIADKVIATEQRRLSELDQRPMTLITLLVGDEPCRYYGNVPKGLVSRYLNGDEAKEASVDRIALNRNGELEEIGTDAYTDPERHVGVINRNGIMTPIYITGDRPEPQPDGNENEAAPAHPPEGDFTPSNEGASDSEPSESEFDFEIDLTGDQLEVTYPNSDGASDSEISEIIVSDPGVPASEVSDSEFDIELDLTGDQPGPNPESDIAEQLGPLLEQMERLTDAMQDRSTFMDYNQLILAIGEISRRAIDNIHEAWSRAFDTIARTQEDVSKEIRR